MIIDLLYNLLNSRFLSTDAIRKLWKPVKDIADSPFCDDLLKKRLYIILGGMTYWVKYQGHWDPPTTEEAIKKELLELTKNPISPDTFGTYPSFTSSVDEVNNTILATAASSNNPSGVQSNKVQEEKKDLSSLIQEALLDQTRGSKEQSEAWESLITTLVDQDPSFDKNKKRKLMNMNPLKKKKVTQKKKNKKNEKNDITKGCEDDNMDLQSTFMNTNFHKPPSIQPIFSETRMTVLASVFPGEVFQIPSTSVEYHQLLERVRDKLKAGPAIRFVVERKRHHNKKHLHTGFFQKNIDSAHSLKAVYEHNALLSSNPQYVEALRVLAILEGRFKQYIEKGGIRAEASQLDKSGLTTTVINKQDLSIDIPTSIFVILAVLEFSSRKAFTLQSQQQGSLNPALQYMLQESLIAYTDKTHWLMLFHIYPNQETLLHLTSDQKTKILNQWMDYVPLLAKFLQGQWVLGVNICATRQMLVPRRGGKVDSDGWNRVTGAWNNSLRYIRLLISELPKEHPLHKYPLFKVLKLTAGDQMSWAEADGKSADPDTFIFCDLTREYLPWIALPSFISKNPLDNLSSYIEELCVKYNVPIQKWLGYAQARVTEEIRKHGPMICGVNVDPSITPEQAQALKVMGFAGAKL